MALNGPPYIGLVHEREAVITGIREMRDEAVSMGDTWTINVVNVRLEILKGYWDRFQFVQRELLLKYSTVAIIYEEHSGIERTTADLMVETKAQMTQLQHNLQATVGLPPAKRPKMSDIRMSTFGGLYTEWTAWRSEFKTKVMDTTLDSSEKISLLLSSLKNEAASCAGRAERLDDCELERIWAKLEKTYDNKYQQAFAHITQILNISPMTHASAAKLRAMIDTTDQHLRMLQRFGIPTDQWSAIICVILLGKLDLETRNTWESKDSLPTIPDLHALFAHLEQRVLAIRNMEQSARQYGSTSQQIQKDEKTSKYPVKSQEQRYAAPKQNVNHHKHVSPANEHSSSKPCPMCEDGTRHPLWKCEAFRALDSAKKFALLKKWKLCELCLIADHAASSCTKGVCPNCQTGKHNSLICPQPKVKSVHHVRGGKRQHGRKPQ